MVGNEKSWWDSIAESLEDTVEGVSEAVGSIINPSMQDKLKSLQNGLAASQQPYKPDGEVTSIIPNRLQNFDI